MKNLTAILFILCAGALAFAQAASPAPVMVAPASQSFLQMLLSHKADFALVIYAILDIVILFVPSLAGNGVIHQILITTGMMSGKLPQASSSSDQKAA